MSISGDALVADLMAERPLLAAEIAHAEAAGKLQDQINQFQTLLEDPTLRPAIRVAIAQQMTRATNSLQKHLHELRQGAKRARARGGGRSTCRWAPVGGVTGGPSPEARSRLHAAVRSSRERTQRLAARAREVSEPQHDAREV